MRGHTDMRMGDRDSDPRPEGGSGRLISTPGIPKTVTK